MRIERITRRELGKLMVAAGFAGRLRASGPVLGLDHIKLRVADLDRSVAFYRSVFDGPLSEMKGGSYLTAPDLPAICLKLGSGKPFLILSPPDSKTPVGLEHITIDRAGMDVARSNAIPQAFPEALPPYEYVRDPAGNLVEFVSSGYWRSGLRRTSPTLPPAVAALQPVFEPVSIQRLSLRVPEPVRAADFYRLFGVEQEPEKGRRTFDFEGTVLELIPARKAKGLEGMAFAVRAFDPAAARRTLRERGIAAAAGPFRNTLVFRDPDGNRIEVSPA